MPNVVPKGPTRYLLPEDQLMLSCDKQIQEKHHYRGFMLSFLTVDLAISHIMGELSRECEKRLASLIDTAKKLQLAEDLYTSEAYRNIPADIRRQHTFVVDDNNAQQALSHALAVADHSLCFHELLLESTRTPELRELLEQLVDQKRNACRIIEEIREA
ncbi:MULTISPECIES: hypothetical protein [Halomonas]|uniref:Ferritin-like metal-binding protein YciE n=1 Tax=Halomonas ventosae TaxID=229007 RepID=A0A4R6I118_9GAMM|nr:hypothetical protein [Halomonas ventosae]TDO15202.1 hypothetical protein DFO68_10233 [Halomonas ventosae]